MYCERHGLTPVIVDDLNIVRIARSEEKADAPARIHRHCPPSGSVSLEFVKPDALQWTEVIRRLGDIQRQQQVHGRGEVEAA
jgi:hypothetical protein